MQERLPLIMRDPVVARSNAPVLPKDPFGHTLRLLQVRKRISLPDLAVELDQGDLGPVDFFGQPSKRKTVIKAHPAAQKAATEAAESLVNLNIATLEGKEPAEGEQDPRILNYKRW